MVIVSLGVEVRLWVSNEPVRSKVAESEDMARREGFVMVAVRRRRREAVLDANMVVELFG